MTGVTRASLPSACNPGGKEIFAFPPHALSHKQRMTGMGGNMRAKQKFALFATGIICSFNCQWTECWTIQSCTPNSEPCQQIHAKLPCNCPISDEQQRPELLIVHFQFSQYSKEVFLKCRYSVSVKQNRKGTLLKHFQAPLWGTWGFCFPFCLRGQEAFYFIITLSF